MASRASLFLPPWSVTTEDDLPVAEIAAAAAGAESAALVATSIAATAAVGDDADDEDVRRGRKDGHRRAAENEVDEPLPSPPPSPLLLPPKLNRTGFRARGIPLLQWGLSDAATDAVVLPSAAVAAVGGDRKFSTVGSIRLTSAVSVQVAMAAALP